MFIDIFALDFDLIILNLFMLLKELFWWVMVNMKESVIADVKYVDLEIKGKYY